MKVYYLFPNQTIRKERTPGLADLLSGKADSSSFAQRVERHRKSARCVVIDVPEERIVSNSIPYPRQLTIAVTLRVKAINYIMKGKPLDYRIEHIPKRNGGTRELCIPNPTLKSFQKKIVSYLESAMPATHHSAAFAYAKGRCPKAALKRHQASGSRWFLKLDLVKFFDNCTPELAERQLKKISGFRALSFDGINDMIFVDKARLPQGAPTSPVFSNLLMIPFDHEFSVKMRKMGFVYTRYADDILISSKDRFDPKTVIEILEKTMEENGYNFKINEEKTRFGSIAGRNWNLGLMLNKDNNITVGYRAKKLLKARLNDMLAKEAANNPWTKEEIAKLAGMVAYHRSIDKDYTDYVIKTFNGKYNIDTDRYLNTYGNEVVAMWIQVI